VTERRLPNPPPRRPPGRQRRRLSIAAWLLAGACASSHAAVPPATSSPVLRPAASLRFEHIGLEEGLPQESVLAILQDRTGFMWFGTQAGLVRFDGYRPRVFRNDPAEPGSLIDNYVHCAYEDGDGGVWFGTRGGLVRFNAARQDFVRYPLSAGGEAGRNSAVSAIAGDGAGGMWIGTGDGLVHLDPRTGAVRTLRRAPGGTGDAGGERVLAMVRDAQGGLWVGGASGLDYLAAGADRFAHLDVDPAGGKANAVWSLATSPDGTLFVGTGAGLEAWRQGAGRFGRHHFGPAEGMDDARVLALYHDAEGGLWVGTDLAGLKRRAPGGGRFTAYTGEMLDRHGLSDNQVTSINVDRTGTLWVGTQFGGVNRVDLASGGFDRFLPAPGPGLLPEPNSRKIRAIAFAPDGRLWLGTTGAGLLALDPATGRTEAVRHDGSGPRGRGGPPDGVVTALLAAHGRLWVGAASGLAWRPVSGGRFTPVVLGRDAASNTVQALMLDRQGLVWVLTRGGLFVLDERGQVLRAWRHDPRDPASLGENYGFSLAQDNAGTVWIGTENGLDRLDGFDRDNPASGRFTHFRHDLADPGSLRHSRVYHVFASARGDLWVGTAAGLHRLERPGGKDAGRVVFRPVPLTAGREQPSVGAILEDAAGRLWVSTTGGIVRVERDGGSPELFTASDGLIDGSYFIGAAARGPDGRLYFGGVNGLSSFMPDAIRGNPYAPVVVITELSVPGRQRPDGPAARPIGAEVDLDYRDPAFTLEFAALHYADPSANRYVYRLRGYDKAWIAADAAKRYATYTNLDPGTYVFEVRAANKDGVWSVQPARLTLRIAPPYWMTWWFRLTAGLAALLAAAAAYRLRIRVLLQRTGRLERQVGARTAELVLQKEGAERQRHEADAQREAAEQARRNIALLSDIGRELTANLDSEAIMAGVSAQVRRLMDADLFAFATVPGPGGRVATPFVAERGARIVAAPACPERVRLLAERSVALFEEILIDDFALDAARYIGTAGAIPGSNSDGEDDASAWPVPRSLLLVPIVVGSRALGALLVQSARPAAYQRVQLDMLGTLASYVGVALDNADAYRRLKETQAQLAASEKLAGLGALVAGVAHELNTPIGNSLLMATTLAEKSDDLAARLAADALKRSDLDSWIAAVREAMALIVRSLQAAADLVNSFKQVSVDQASAQRRDFDLATACHEITATIMNQVRRAGHRLELRVAPGIRMDSYPGPLGQVLINFINNALLHAFDGPGGTMVLSASTPEEGRVRIVFSDDGRGVAPEHQSRIFDPFFTTRMGQGGTGLGLNIAWTIVTTLLRGTIRVESPPGQGAAFILDLPLRAG
jgi:ligand-binding sensor domain-containing protein/signal transduction histidine kinase